jgi:putative glutamine amidotransferase
MRLVKKLELRGVLLTGGDDIGKFPERDETENMLIKWALEGKVPIIGVCRGMQVIQKYFGGALVNVSPLKHIAKRHSVYSETGVREVNSFHGLGITEAASGLHVTSTAEDGVIESIEADGIIGVMWHPEREKTPDPLDMDMFRRHFKSCVAIDEKKFIRQEGCAG